MTTAPDRDRVHDLGADRRAALLEELFAQSSEGAHLADNSTARGPLTPAILLNHVLGKARAGAIPFIDARRVGWAAIDLDVRRDGAEPDDPEVLAMLDAIVQCLAGDRLRGIVERSKSKGWHVWTFFDAPIEAAHVRAYLRSVALEAGATDAPDLVCPRQDERGAAGNGVYLPLFGDASPYTWPHVWDESGDLLPVAPSELAGFLREVIDHPSPTDRVPRAEPESKQAGAPEEHACAWIVDELAEAGVVLAGVVYLRGSRPEHEKIAFACPLHAAPKRRPRGGSAVMFAEGRGHCSSAKCGRTWRSVAEFVELAGGATARPRAPLLTPGEFALDEPPAAIVECLVYEGSLHSLTGASKAGKSYAAMQLAMCVATGRNFLGLRTSRTRVLYVGLEMSAGILRNRMEAIAADAGVPMPRIGDDLHVIATTRERVVSLDLGDARGRAELRERIAEAKAGMVILDTLYRFLPGADPNDNAVMGVAFGDLLDLAHETGAAVWMLDHVRKGEAGGPVSHSALGAAVKGGQRT